MKTRPNEIAAQLNPICKCTWCGTENGPRLELCWICALPLDLDYRRAPASFPVVPIRGAKAQSIQNRPSFAPTLKVMLVISLVALVLSVARLVA